MANNDGREKSDDAEEFDVETLVTKDGVALYRLLLQNPHAVVVTSAERKKAEDALRYLWKKDARLAFAEELTAQEACEILQYLVRRYLNN